MYLAVLCGCLVFYVAYREWFSWLALVAVVWLPWFSLLLSLPAMLTAKVRLHCPTEIQMGTPVRPTLRIGCLLPAPPVRCRLTVRPGWGGSASAYTPEDPIPVDHCGILEFHQKNVWVYDYLGLLRLPRGKAPVHTLTVLPKPVPIGRIPSLEHYMAGAWRPKAGGGFAENHDLRLYRPGDDLRHIHWKLAAKTGKLVFREPIEPHRGSVLLTLTLCGCPEEIDRKLGKLLWLSAHLLEHRIPHQLRCLTGRGVDAYTVTDKAGLMIALRKLLASPAAPEEAAPEPAAASWQYHIGGGDDEA